MLRKIVLAVCTVATLNMSAGLTGASAAPHGGHPGGHPGGGGGPHFSGGHPGFRGGYGGGYGGGYAVAPYGYGYDPYGYDPGYDPGYVPYGYAPYGYSQGYDPGPAIAAGIIGTAIGAIIGAQRHGGCWYHNHHRVCR